MILKKPWRPSKEQHRKWRKLFYDNKHIPLHLITTTQARSFKIEPEGMIFVDRDPEKVKIKKVLETIAQTKQTIAIRISGAGGVGKTHFIRYIQHLIKTKTVFRELDLDLTDIQFDCCILDAPKQEDLMNFYYIYTQMWEGLGREDFFEEFSTIILKKLLKILNEIATQQIDELFESILGKDWRFLKDLSYQEVRSRFETLTIENFNKFREILKKNFRSIFEHIKKEIAVRNIRSFFSNIISLIEILVPDYIKCIEAIENWQLINLSEEIPIANKEDKALKKFQDLLEIYSWLYPNFVWILAMDDLDHLENPLIRERLFDLIKTFRNETHNFCIILTATIDQWTALDDSMIGTDKKKQLEGIFTYEISYFDMDYLPDHEMLNWLGRIIQSWWEKLNIKLPLDALWFPFSRNAMEFIINYDPNNKTPRAVGNRLLDLWNKLTTSFQISGKLFIETEFDAWKLLSKADYTKLNPYTQKLLLDYRIKEKYGTFSSAIEKGIEKALLILKKSQEFRLIEIVEVRKNKEFIDDSFDTKSKSRQADVFIKLQEPGATDLARIEIQVKAGDPNREITLEELKSSIELLKYNHIDFLIMLSFSDLSSLVKRELEKFPHRYNITATNLSEEQTAFCILLAYFNEIAERDLTPFEAANIFLKIFGESPHIYLRNLLKSKKELIEYKVPLLEEEKISIKADKGTLETSIMSEISQKTMDSFVQTLPTPKVKDVYVKEDNLKLTIKWILKKGIERTRQWKNRVTKTWLLNREDSPKKEDLVKAWKKLIESTKYGRYEKTTFYIDVDKAKTLIES